jgi:hypothetical protein
MKVYTAALIEKYLDVTTKFLSKIFYTSGLLPTHLDFTSNRENFMNEVTLRLNARVGTLKGKDTSKGKEKEGDETGLEEDPANPHPQFLRIL